MCGQKCVTELTAGALRLQTNAVPTRMQLQNVSNLCTTLRARLLTQIAKILTSLSRVFNTSSVLLTLCGEQRVWIRNAIGFSAGEFAWRWAFCGWSLAPPTPQVLVIEDTLQDAR